LVFIAYFVGGEEREEKMDREGVWRDEKSGIPSSQILLAIQIAQKR
jgi:hypothetical protein